MRLFATLVKLGADGWTVEILYQGRVQHRVGKLVQAHEQLHQGLGEQGIAANFRGRRVRNGGHGDLPKLVST